VNTRLTKIIVDKRIVYDYTSFATESRNLSRPCKAGGVV
jgi:hypothetical protein